MPPDQHEQLCEINSIMCTSNHIIIIITNNCLDLQITGTCRFKQEIYTVDYVNCIFPINNQLSNMTAFI